MIFVLSLLDDDEVDEFLSWAEAHLAQQTADFSRRFDPALKGLVLAAQGQSLDSDVARASGARRFLGWSKERHWMLPDVSGLEVARRARDSVPPVPVIMVTGYPTEASRNVAKQLGVYSYLNKPFDLNDLRQEPQGNDKVERHRRGGDIPGWLLRDQPQ